MSNLPMITVVGNLTKDPELRFTPSGSAVCNLTVAVNERIKDGDEWKDGEATFYEVAVWNQTAENVAESLQSGLRVMVHGRLKGRKWTSQDGTKSGTSLDITVGNDGAIGPDLKFATAKVTRASRSSNGGQQGGGYSQAPPSQGAPSQGAPSQDPWATPAPVGAPAGGGYSGGDEPPF